MGKTTGLRIKLNLFVFILVSLAMATLGFSAYKQVQATGAEQIKKDSSTVTTALAERVSAEIRHLLDLGHLLRQLEKSQRPAYILSIGSSHLGDKNIKISQEFDPHGEGLIRIESRGLKVDVAQSRFTRILAEASPHYSYIVDREGHILAQSKTRHHKIGENLSHIPIVSLAKANEDQQSSLSYSEIPGKTQYIGSYHRIHLAGLTVISQQESSALNKTLNRLLTHFGVAAGVILLLALILSSIATQGLYAEDSVELGNRESKSITESVAAPLEEDPKVNLTKESELPGDEDVDHSDGPQHLPSAFQPEEEWEPNPLAQSVSGTSASEEDPLPEVGTGLPSDSDDDEKFLADLASPSPGASVSDDPEIPTRSAKPLGQSIAQEESISESDADALASDLESELAELLGDDPEASA